MSVFVSAKGLPFVFEYPDDSLDEVGEQYRQFIEDGRCISFNAQTADQKDVETHVLVNFARLTIVLVGRLDPDVDENGVRDPEGRMLVTARLNR